MRLARKPAPKAVVDIDHADPGRATGHHAQQSGHAVKRRAVTYAGRNGDDRFIDQATDHAGQCALHAGDDDEYPGAAQILHSRKQTVQSGDANVVNSRSTVLP